MPETRLKEIVKRAAQVALDAGASDARVFASRSRDVTVEWRDGKLDRIQESTSQGLSISVYVDGKFSANSTSDLRPQEVVNYVRGAVATTRYLAADLHRKLPDPARYENPTREDLGLMDPTVGSVTPEQRLKEAAALEDATRAADADKKIVSVTTWVSDSQSMSAGFSTNGFEGSEEETSFSRGATASIADEKDRKPRGTDYGACRFAADLPSIEQLGKGAIRRAMEQLGSRQVATGKYDIIIENRCAPTFTGHLLGPLSGSAIQQKRSFLDGQMDQAIGSPRLTVTSEPHLFRGLSSSAWDAEGMITRTRPVFEGGKLRTYFLDTYYASKLGVAPTSGSFSNLVWQPGAETLDEMIAHVKKGILITSFLGGNSNTTTGDFSLGIKGHYVENGEIKHSISEMNIAGNHLDIWKSLALVGNDPWKHSRNLTPSLLFEGVQCSGA